ncbi:MAG: tetratricopeptide repeat protein [Calditrichaeota bacterium]|nr:MAG: tetratricopeptide repeat protein [Calditrichota bacterium]
MFKDVIKEQLKVPAHIDYLGELRDFVTRVGNKYGLSNKIINAYKLGIDEAGTNIIRHAYREQSEPGFILLRVIIRKNSATVSLIDTGKYFDPRTVKAPDLDRYVEIGKKGGLGIFIIRKLMDEIDYRKTEEGNELRMTKYRDRSKKKTSTRPDVLKSAQGIPFTLKGQYFWRITLAFTVAVMGSYGYLYFKAGSEKTREAFNRFNSIGQTAKFNLESLAKNNLELADESKRKDILRNEYYDEISLTVEPILEEKKAQIIDLFVVDNRENLISGHININWQGAKYGTEYPRLPAEVVQLSDSVKLYNFELVAENDRLNTAEVYDFSIPVHYPFTGEKYGKIHVLALKEKVDSEISTLRWAYFQLTLSILILAYVGVFVLIYILLNPFKKLASWIRAIDHGEVDDEMDIDASTEIGEIAQAFSEMTTKFRESQKNLAEQERLQKEMQVAQEIQQTLLPSEVPKLEGCEISSYYEAAKEVGGDYYDFVQVDKDTLGVVVADVSGKGVPGSLVMTMIRTALRTEARGVHDAAEVLARVNEFVATDMKKGMFVTVFYVIIDAKRRRLNFASAGHNPMILYRPSTEKTYYLNPKGFPIGIQLAEKDLFRQSIESDTIQMTEDDIVLLYTDGITEAMNGRRQLFGEERLLQIIRQGGKLNAEDFVDKLRLEIDTFIEGNLQYDDITCVTIKEESNSEKEELRRAKLAHQEIESGTNIREACEKAGITTYAYYNKYKKTFDEHGVDAYEIDEEVSLEAKHFSIEDKTKIFDIIKNHPEYGAKRISEELNTEKYGFTIITEKKIYDELVRSRLNTKNLREAYIARGARNKKRIKAPGTPMLTLDGRILIDRKEEPEEEPISVAETVVPETKTEKTTEVDISQKEENVETTEVESDSISQPLEELLQKPDDDESQPGAATETTDSETGELQDAEATNEAELEEDSLSFLDILQGGEKSSDEDDEFETEVEADAHGDDYDVNSDRSNNSSTYDAVDDLLQQEISNSFADDSSSSIFVDQEEISQVSEEDDGNLIEEKKNLANTTTDEVLPQNSDSEAESDLDEQLPEERGFKDETLELLSTDLTSSDADDENASPFIEVTDGKSGDFKEDEKFPHDKTDDTGIFIELFSAANDAEPDGADMLPMFTDPHEVFVKKRKNSRNGLKQQDIVTGEARRDQLKEKEGLLIEGLRYYKRKEFDEAILKFNDAVEKYPDFKEAHSILGNAFFRTGRYDDAIGAYSDVIKLDSTDATAHENIGVIYANKGDYSKAVEQWKKILKHDPSRADIKLKINKALDLIGHK